MRRLFTLIVLVLLAWAAIPALHAAALIEMHAGGAIVRPAGLPVRDVRFTATDGVALRGWLAPASPHAPAVILVPGWRGDRASMVPYARMLHAGGYAVLLYDPRGTGKSGGHFTFGAREVDDVVGAARFLSRTRPHRSIGLLGLSMGASDAIVAASRSAKIRATVADSAATTENAVIDGLNHLHLGPLSIPLAPDSAWTTDRVANVSIESFRPIDAVSHIAPRALLLIHDRGDDNSTTPLAGAWQLRRTAGSNAALWIAPVRGHAEALTRDPAAYRRHVLEFFSRYLGR